MDIVYVPVYIDTVYLFISLSVNTSTLGGWMTSVSGQSRPA